MLKQELFILLNKEFKQELKHKHTIGSILLYVFATVFVCYLSFKHIVAPPVWNALFWIILLFASINTVAKSFVSENRARQFMMYSLASPQAIILSKAIYNALFLCVVSLISFFMYSLFIGNMVQDSLYFFIAVMLGSMGFGFLLTMVSAIASKAGNNLSLMAVLSFPLLIPLLITLIKLSKNAVDGLDRSISNPLIIMTACINLIAVALMYILFPYVWKE
jgi:heme exporter protein B